MTLDDTVRLELPATHKYLHLLGSCIEGVLARIEGLADLTTITYNVQLAAHEICTNIVDHAYEGRGDGRIQTSLTIEDAGHRIVIDLWDQGNSFEPGAVPEPILGEPQVHGYGLFLAEQLLDTVQYEAHPGGNHWQLTKRL
jgi:serine/threonine-protein kinase RsbW